MTVQLGASRDSTIFDSGAGDIANGSGEFILSGGEGSDEVARRGLLSFDIDSAGIPFGSTILDVSLTLSAAFSIGGATDIGLYRVLNAWGEGASDAIGDEIEGAPAEAQDATWLYRFFNGSVWNSPGGDYSAGTSASANIDVPGMYQWTDEIMIHDVQQWLDDPNGNFGWMLLSEPVPGNLKAFHSRNSSNAALHPKLEITYEEPVLPALIAGRTWNDVDGDGLRVPQVVRDLQLRWHLEKDYFNSYRGQEYWFRSSVNNQWYFLTPDGTLTKWDKSPGQLSGTVVTQMSSRIYQSQNRSLLLSGNAGDEQWQNGVTLELIDQFGVVVDTTISADFDENRDGNINPETERGWYRFSQVTEGAYLIRQVMPENMTASVGRYSALAKHVYDLDSQLNLRFYRSLYENFGGHHERWMLGDNGWYYITPDGNLFKWKAQAINENQPLTGTLVLELSPSYYRDPSLVYDAQDPLLQATDGMVLGDVDFGSFHAISISGRVWHDRNGDGVQNSDDYLTVTSIETPPVGGPAKAVFWYQSAESDENATDHYYYADQYGNLFEWNPVAGSTFMTQLWGGFENSSSVVLNVTFITEPYQNGWSVELVDSAGRVVATTVSSDLDRNGDNQIQPGTERGWYEFVGLLPGQYSVRQVQETGWIQTTQPSSSQQATASQLQQSIGFKLAAKDWYDFGFRNERWIQGRNNQWYYITPNGNLYDWDRRSGGAKGVVNGTLLAKLSPGFYLNLNLLISPPLSTVQATAGTQLNGGDFGNHRVADGLFSELTDELLGGS